MAERLAASAELEAREAGKPAPAGPGGPVAPPVGMSEEELQVWAELAPLAIEARTLATGTARAFALLCKAIVLERSYLSVVREEGWTVFTPAGPKAHPLIGPHRGILQRVEAALVRFKLSPIGKELEIPAESKPQSKLAMLRGG